MTLRAATVGVAHAPRAALAARLGANVRAAPSVRPASAAAGAADRGVDPRHVQQSDGVTLGDTDARGGVDGADRTAADAGRDAHARKRRRLRAHTLALYRYTMRQAERVGTVEPNAVNYYKDNAREQFNAFADETEPDGIVAAQRRAPEMVAWVLRKFGLAVGEAPAPPAER